MTSATPTMSQAEFLERFIRTPAGQAVLESQRAEELQRRRDAETAIAEIKAKAAGDCPPLRKEMDKLLEEINAEQRKIEAKRRRYQKLSADFQAAGSMVDIAPHQRFLMQAHDAEVRAFVARLEAERERLKNPNLKQETREPRYFATGRIDNALLRGNHLLIKERFSATWQAERDARELTTWKAEITADLQALWDGLPGIELTKHNVKETTFNTPMFEAPQ